VTDGKIVKTIHESIPSWPVERRPRESSPNNLVVLFDDTGFSEFRLLQFTDPHAGHRLASRASTRRPCARTTRSALLTGATTIQVGSPRNIETI
jgi:hypothetical protein